MICILAGFFLFSACDGATESGPTSTPDPLSITIWDFEEIRKEVLDLAATAADTKAENLESVIKQMTALKEEISGYEFPLIAAQAHSALYNFAFNTEQCYFGIFAEYLAEISDQETMLEHEDRCVEARTYQETFDQYLQELKDNNAAE
jgi:hypothetical protein